MSLRASRPFVRLFAIVAAALAAVTVLATANGGSPAGAQPTFRPHIPTRTKPALAQLKAQRLAAAQEQARAIGGKVHWAVDGRPACATAHPGGASCFAVARRSATEHTAGAYPYASTNDVPSAPAGGYTPADLASAYGYNPDVNRSTTTVGVIDWYNDPNALADLNKFDHQYGLKPETSTSFRKVNQFGGTTWVHTSHDTALEIALDIQAVRAVCHTCRILLVEANTSSETDLAAAVNRAVTMGASVISNSYGEPEGSKPVSSSVRAAYNHPGVVITASTGDDGWYGWDYASRGEARSDSSPAWPATDPDVVSVGGTTLELKQDSSGHVVRNTETVWNDNGREDDISSMGATGGGCSKLYSPWRFQTDHAGYAAANCHGKRLAADVSATASPADGFGVYDTYGKIGTTPNTGWTVVGGTSLSAPLIAGMFALEGGGSGSAYPAASLYVNAQLNASRVFDVKPLGDDADNDRTSGNSYCGGVDAPTCGNDSARDIDTHNPNNLYLNGGKGQYAGLLDCSFPRTNVDKNATATSPECNTVPGYDGPTGIGAPNTASLMYRTIFRLSYSAPTSGRLNQTLAFTAGATPTVSGQSIHQFTYSWGDGTPTYYLTYGATHHTFRKRGTFVVTVGVTDNYGQVVIKRTTVKIS